MIRDLKHWETLLTSSFMQRPHKILAIDQAVSDELHEAQNKNLASALAFVALTKPSGILSEHDLYQEIVMIPHYEQKYLQLLDKEDEEGVVECNFAEF